MKTEEKDQFKGKLLSATHKAAKIISSGKLVSPTEFQNFVEEKTGPGYFGMFLRMKISYDGMHSLPEVKIWWEYKPHIFVCSFKIVSPPGKFSGKIAIPETIIVEEI